MLTEKEFRAGAEVLKETSARVFGDNLVLIVIGHLGINTEGEVVGADAAVCTGKEEGPGHMDILIRYTAAQLAAQIEESKGRPGHSGLS